MLTAADSSLVLAPSGHLDGEPDADPSTRFWISFLRIGFVATILEAGTALTYVVVASRLPHRIAQITVPSTVLVFGTVGLATVRLVAGRRWRVRYSLAWCLAMIGAVSVSAYLDLGVESPFVYLLPLPVVYACIGLRPKHVRWCSLAALLGYAVIAASDSDVTRSSGNLLMTTALLMGITGVSAALASVRARMEREERSLTARLAHLSVTDGLTGCGTYRAFHTRLVYEMDRADRYELPLSLLVGDVDFLRSYNDIQGHLAGDQALAQVGSVLLAKMRAGDFVGRIGGDEFGVIMPATTASEAAAAARRIVSYLGDSCDPPIGLSIGVGTRDGETITTTQLFRRADAALYEAKAAGRRTVVVNGEHDDGFDVILSSPAARPPIYSDEDVKRRDEMMRQAHTETEEVESALSVLIDSSPVGFGLVDGDYRVLRVNKALAAAFANTLQTGMFLPDLLGDLWPSWEGPIRCALEGGANADPLLLRTLGDGVGEARDWSVALHSVRTRDRVFGVAFVAFDMTDRLEIERSHERMTDAIVASLARAAEARDPYTAGHQDRVAQISVAIAEDLGYDQAQVRSVRLAASIHDIGKIATPTEILSKPGRLSAAEYAVIQEHARAGYDIVNDAHFPAAVADIILQHHERLNGSGYPQQLVDDQICDGALIVGAADTLEAMSAHRPYRAALGIDAALATLTRDRGELFSPPVVDSCLKLAETGQLDHILGLPATGQDVLRAS